MGIPAAYPPSIRESAIELLRDAEKSGKNRAQAAKEVAESFTDGPSAGTLVNWAKQEGLFASAQHRPEGNAAAQKPQYDEDFKRQVADRVADLMNTEGLTLRAAALRLIEDEPGMPSLATIRRWARTYLEFVDDATPTDEAGDDQVADNADSSPLPNNSEEAHAVATIEVPPTSEEVDAPPAAVVPTDESSLAVQLRQLVEENEELRQRIAELSPLAEEVVILRTLLAHYARHLSAPPAAYTPAAGNATSAPPLQRLLSDLPASA